MLLRPHDMSEPLYDPIHHLSQTELMEKFNLAFYEAQNLSKSDLLTTFNEEDVVTTSSDDYLIDYLISDSPASDADVNFDFGEFVADFDNNVQENFDTETFTTTTESSVEGEGNGEVFSQFYVPPPFDVDLDCGLDLDAFPSPGDFQALPPVGTITKNNVDFNSFVRSVPPDDLSFFNQDVDAKNEFGHLIGTRCVNNNVEQAPGELFQPNLDNQLVVTQHEALLNDDPLLSSSNIIYPDGSSNDYEEVSSSTNFQCRWEQCYLTYESQSCLVKHIEKSHVELKRGDEFTCYWEHCPRKTKPFNARYKLLIHMRVHSGEKPNKCPFKGCDKAFSRLENLKIHQRSHTGERPYLCQFPTCTKSFSNSSDRAKHQRTHFDTKPYACQVVGCAKKYTDPSSLRKHVKNHTYEEQMQIKKRSCEEGTNFIAQSLAKKYLDSSKQRAVKVEGQAYSTSYEHNYSNNFVGEKKYDSLHIKLDLKNKISEKNRLRKTYC
ncbi:hypothetical protein NQ315_000223 [Exocentrus adspersus]|uniref:C2H2-type domain-containing protein n=1 Tax=Exocentrus adspersus TaxID=1586481 RepID=A0AAV8VR02_9CUCU|nr:hypothetical protein NQ315_000223 [Exocentrus adspersus]